MAERRMFTKRVTDDDNFMSLSSSAQALYLHLSMSADDDGFCNLVSIAMFRSHASVNDLEALLSRRYLIQFENGVIVIRHWRMANALRKDRYTPTIFKKELSMLQLDSNLVYEEKSMVAERLPDGCQVVAERLPQDRLGKDRLGKERLGEVSIGKVNSTVSKDTVCQTETVRLIVDEWNSLENCGIKKVSKLAPNTKRYSNLIARINQYGKDQIMDAIQKIRESEFLQGNNSRGWVITFEWFVLPNNFPKVLEGQYENRVKVEPQKKTDVDEWMELCIKYADEERSGETADDNSGIFS